MFAFFEMVIEDKQALARRHMIGRFPNTFKTSTVHQHRQIVGRRLGLGIKDGLRAG